MHSVVDAVLLFLHFDFGSSTDLDHGNAAGKLGQAFLELFAVVVARGGFDLLLDLTDTALDGGSITGTFHDRGVVLRDGDGLGLAKDGDRSIFELGARVFGNQHTASEDSDVFEHGLATVTEARGLDGGDLQGATHLVHNERCESFAIDVFGDDEERLALLCHVFEHREQILHGRNLLVVQQDERIFESDFHAVRVRHEVRREVATVELHAFDNVEDGFCSLGFFDGDDAIVADLFHSVGEEFANFGVVVGRNRCDLGNVFLAVDLHGHLADFLDDGVNRSIHAALDVHRVCTGSDVLQAFTSDSLSENGCSRGAVTGSVARLVGDFLGHLGAEVFVSVFEFHFLSDGHAVLGDVRGTEGAGDHHVTALGAESYLDSVGELVHALHEGFASRHIKLELLCHFDFSFFI